MIKIIIPSLLYSIQVQASSSLEQNLELIRVKHEVPALGAMLISNGKVRASAITGIRKFGDPTKAEISDKFHLGSCTKAMTATVFATLVEDKKILWTSTLSEILPELKSMNKAYQNVTVEMLLAHRGGLTGDLNSFDNGSLMKKFLDPAMKASEGYELVAHTLLSATPLEQPGSTKIYSNAGYIIVGHIIEKISGKSWEQMIEERLFKPLNMSSCGFGPAGNAAAKVVDQPWSHYKENNTTVAIAPTFKADNPPVYGPAGRVHCSMEDWGKFLNLHIDGFNKKKTALLKKESFEKLHNPYPGQTYTYGGWIREDRSWAGGVVLTHAGSNLRNYATVWIAPLRESAYMSVSNIAQESGAKATDAAIGALIQETK